MGALDLFYNMSAFGRFVLANRKLKDKKYCRAPLYECYAMGKLGRGENVETGTAVYEKSENWCKLNNLNSRTHGCGQGAQQNPDYKL